MFIIMLIGFVCECGNNLQTPPCFHILKPSVTADLPFEMLLCGAFRTLVSKCLQALIIKLLGVHWAQQGGCVTEAAFKPT